jgi:hypothetical protein
MILGNGSQQPAARADLRLSCTYACMAASSLCLHQSGGGDIGACGRPLDRKDSHGACIHMICCMNGSIVWRAGALRSDEQYVHDVHDFLAAAAARSDHHPLVMISLRRQAGRPPLYSRKHDQRSWFCSVAHAHAGTGNFKRSDPVRGPTGIPSAWST